MPTKRALLVAASVEVVCPHCGDPQPSPTNDSDLWTWAEIRALAAMSASRVCNACDDPFLIEVQRPSIPAAD